MTTNYTTQLHPNSIPKFPALVIYEDDERNNADFLRKNPGVTVLPKTAMPEGDIFENLTSGSYDLDEDETSINDYPQNIYEPTENTLLSPPENLLIDDKSYKVQTDANDGTVLYRASLTFSKVTNAEDYEVRLTIATA